MEGDRLLHVEVPVAPLVSAGRFEVLVGIADLLQMGMEGAVLIQQRVLGAAVDPEGMSRPISAPAGRSDAEPLATFAGAAAPATVAAPGAALATAGASRSIAFRSS